MPLIPSSTDLETGLVVLTEPTSEPVTLAQVKDQVRQGTDMTLDDTFITRLITAARKFCEKRIRRSMVNTTWRFTSNRFPMAGDFTFWGSYNGGPIRLPRSPVSLVSAGGAYAYDLPRIQYYDGAGAVQTLTRGTHWEDDFTANPPCLQLCPNQFWPMTQVGKAKPVIVDFVAGYGADASSVPEDLKQAVLLLVAHWYQNREGVLTGSISKNMEFSLDAILAGYHDGGYP